ncbi:hypothetical protein F9C28_03355 [Shimwellia pseudoproteus]|nr:protein YebF [Shimwellia pseudoproteus]MBJ3813993.1 hypothetical protein [Shimwellia pseudoproteus]
MSAVMLPLLAFPGLSAAASPSRDTPREVTIPPCTGVDAAGIAALVKQDYLTNRVVAWAADRDILGQDDPVAWVNTADIVGQGDHWQVPLMVRGKQGDIHYSVVVECKTGTVHYMS